jgi:signal transduction histidine kinase
LESPAHPGDSKGGAYFLTQPIRNQGETLGNLQLWANFNSTYRDMVQVYSLVLAGVLAGSFFVALLMSARLQRFISEPIQHLAAVARAIGEQKDYSVRAQPQGRDEVGLLTDAFNDMVSQIQARATEVEGLHRQLLDTSRQAGMAEVASSVLHNVGNVLNSVNVSCAVANEHVTKLDVVSLREACALLREHAADLGTYLTADPQGQQVPAFLNLLAEHFAGEQTAIAQELESLRKNIDHIKEIVAMQQSYAKVSGVVETLPAATLVEDALRMNAGALTRHGVTVVRQFAKLPDVLVDKHKVLQILVNLIRNAKYAMDERGDADKTLTVRISATGSAANGHADRMSIEVSDNGVGIPPENLSRIFQHGFTTRRDGHGFGLHSGALAAKELGGSLRAHSAGPGQGATFTLELPLKPTQVHEFRGDTDLTPHLANEATPKAFVAATAGETRGPLPSFGTETYAT